MPAVISAAWAWALTAEAQGQDRRDGVHQGLAGDCPLELLAHVVVAAVCVLDERQESGKGKRERAEQASAPAPVSNCTLARFVL